ncbi:MAG: cytochrome c peroxidase, partial [Gemmatimonadaceae bacterium]
LLSLAPALGGATPNPRPRLDREALRAIIALYTRPDSVPHPADNSFSPERRALGKLLFFDTRLSGGGEISCASCHSPGKSYGDGLPRAIGAAKTPLGRRTPTVLNTAYASTLFWDGRAETLEQQALGPVQAAGEMNLPLPEMTKRLNGVAEYRELFRNAYGSASITADLVGKAIAQFERTVNSTLAPFDRWVSGDERAVSEAAKRGFVVFNGKGNCASCHSGWRLTDDSFHDIGIAGADTGRAAVIPGIEAIRFAFKTPTLRNVVERAPYMHDGSERTLEAVIDLYDRGGNARRASLSPLIKPLGLLPREKRDLIAFLRTLSSRDTVSTPARFPR